MWMDSVTAVLPVGDAVEGEADMDAAAVAGDVGCSCLKVKGCVLGDADDGMTEEKQEINSNILRNVICY